MSQSTSIGHIPIRLAFCSVAVFAVTGLHLPFWPVWLEAQGVGPEGIGILVALGYFTRMFAGPGFAYLADLIGDRRAPFIWLAVAHLAGLSAFWFTDGFMSIALITLIASGAYSPLIPLKESLTMGWVEQEGFDYGRIRLWGSVSFIVVSVAGGFVLSPFVVLWTGGVVPAPFGTDAILTGLMLLTVLMIIAGVLLPVDPRKGDHHTRPKLKLSAVGALMMTPSFVLFLIAASAVMASHAVYYAFGTLNWQAIGYSNGFIGGLWALGVVAEIVLFAFSVRFISKLSPPVLIMMGALAAIVRWTWTGFDPHWSVLLVLQCLHAFTFGATHLGVMHYIARAVPTELAATAQGIYAAFGGGVVMGLIMLATGPAYEEFGALAYLAMSGLGFVGLAAGALLWRGWHNAKI